MSLETAATKRCAVAVNVPNVFVLKNAGRNSELENNTDERAAYSSMCSMFSVSEDDPNRVRPVEIVLQFIKDNSEALQLEYISCVSYKNGEINWTCVMFSCLDEKHEQCMDLLAKLGIGRASDGIGNVSCFELLGFKLGSRPKVAGSTTKPTGQNKAAETPVAASAGEGEQRLSKAVSAPEQDKMKKLTLVTSMISETVAEDDEEGEEQNEADDSDAVKGQAKVKVRVRKEIYEDFHSSMQNRISINKILAMVYSGARFSFDYVVMVCVASFLAAVGLVTNSQVVLVASMLVSPLMGPILAVTLGLTIGEKHLLKKGLIGELVGLVICVMIGFLCCFIFVFFLGHEWPTDEMSARVTWQGIAIGVLVAFPSGIGVAISILSENQSSLVGVAISASLLPPAVNTGLYFGLSVLKKVDSDLIQHNQLPRSRELIKDGLLSFLLTLVNILCIWVSGVIMFKIKKVRLAGDIKEQNFWAELNKPNLQDKAKKIFSPGRSPKTFRTPLTSIKLDT